MIDNRLAGCFLCHSICFALPFSALEHFREQFRLGSRQHPTANLVAVHHFGTAPTNHRMILREEYSNVVVAVRLAVRSDSLTL